jgi:hypothetical protein
MIHKSFHFETNFVGFNVAELIYRANYVIIIMCGTNLGIISFHAPYPTHPLTP